MARSSSDQGRGRLPFGLVGVAALIALVAAYLSDCIPGLGSGGDIGTPSSQAPATPEAPATLEPPPTPPVPELAADPRIAITVQGEQCRLGQAAAAPCPEVCAALDRTHAATVEVTLEATEGRHGTVEDLRQCLQDAGFATIRVHAE